MLANFGGEGVGRGSPFAWRDLGIEPWWKERERGLSLSYDPLSQARFEILFCGAFIVWSLRSFLVGKTHMKKLHKLTFLFGSWMSLRWNLIYIITDVMYVYIFHFSPTPTWMQVPDMMNRPSLEKPTDFNNLSAEGKVGGRKETASHSCKSKMNLSFSATNIFAFWCMLYNWPLSKSKS